jgi:hypothetical protein
MNFCFVFFSVEYLEDHLFLEKRVTALSDQIQKGERVKEKNCCQAVILMELRLGSATSILVYQWWWKN